MEDLVYDIAPRSVRTAVVSSMSTVRDLSLTVGTSAVADLSDTYNTLCSMSGTYPWTSAVSILDSVLNLVLVIPS